MLCGRHSAALQLCRISNMVSPHIRTLLEAKLGHPIRYPSDCARLSIDILAVTGQHLGVTTLKRMLGFANDVFAPRVSTLDIVASYLGYPHFSRLLDDIGDDSDLCPLADKKIIVAQRQPVGSRLKVYLPCPAHAFVLEYCGEMDWIVRSTSVSSLLSGDRLYIPLIVEGQPLTVVAMNRGGRCFGPMVIGANNGIANVENCSQSQ